jgi:hypothetical protein
MAINDRTLTEDLAIRNERKHAVTMFLVTFRMTCRCFVVARWSYGLIVPIYTFISVTTHVKLQ